VSLLRAEGLAKEFGGVRAVEGLDFEVDDDGVTIEVEYDENYHGRQTTPTDLTIRLPSSSPVSVETVSSSITVSGVRGALAIPMVVAIWFAYTWIGPLHGPTAPMFGFMMSGLALTLAAAAVSVRLVRSNMSGLAAAAVVAFVLLIFPVIVGHPPSLDPARPPLGDPLAYWSTLTLLSIGSLAAAHSDRFQRS